MATEEPNYTILNQTENLELRRYEVQIVAETWMAGDQKEASREGFKALADFIFGNNTAPSGASSKIEMTAPVIIQPQNNNFNNESNKQSSESNQSAQIAMTGPVSMQQDEGKWRIRFVMPSIYTLQSLPKPNNSAVIINEIPVQTYGVIKFSGLAGSEKVASKTEELRQWMQSQHLEITGRPELARYNPPWTLPFMRRNEVLIAYQQ